MFRSLIVIFTIPVIVFLTFAAPVPKHLMQKPEPAYFPTKVGAKWVRQHAQEEYTEVVTEVGERPDGAKVVSVGHVNPNGEVLSARTVAVSSKGLFLLSQGGHVFDTDATYCLLKLPHQPGDGWKNEKRSFWDRTCTVYGSEWVEVPAGRFWAMRVESTEYRIPNKLARTTSWYAPEVGEVKHVSTPFRDDEADYVTVLKSFTPGGE
ncbi:hypothetical protein R5W24_003346 [Gemmata sp. JC717]|uniref:hypothetical protein n=1 Tax=Gemmata algarum TaxID=2975278 RepID=UPI0021BACAD8|nr:hypothetical protein [Gemmata algarum]MDY3554227.1 hypothetical protein [Gemmata algarum]